MSRRDKLIAEFAAWLAEHSTFNNVDAGDLGLLLDWKQHYGDGESLRWRVEDIDEFLLNYCPRKVSASAELAAGIPGAVAAAMVFLTDRRLLRKGSDPGPELAGHALSRTEAFLDAMSDPSNFGMAKGLFAAAGIAPDFDLAAPGALDEIIDRINDLPAAAFEAPTTSPAMTVGPVRSPAAEDVLASAAAAPVLARFALLHHACAQPGLKLTTNGNLNLADARRLVELLETGDKPDQTIGDHTYKLRSAVELRGLTRWVDWALAAGVVRRYRGRLVAIAAWSKKARNPIAAVDNALATLLRIGPVSIGVHWEGYLQLAMFVEDGIGRLLAELLDDSEPAEIERLCAVMTDAARFAQRVLPLLTDPTDALAPLVERFTRDLLDRLAECGLVRLDGVRFEETQHLLSHRAVGGTAALTPAGMPVAIRLANQLGIEVVQRADPAVATAADMVDLIGVIDQSAWQADIEVWASGRPAVRAIGELVHALADPADRPEYAVLTGFESLYGVFGAAVTPAIRTLVDGPRDALALLWLSQHGELDPATIAPERMLAGGVALFAAMLDLDGPDGLLRSLANHEDPGVELDLVSDLWRSTHPRTFEVLTVIGSNHPNKNIAKAARKSAFKHGARTERR